ncbi:hypothetical protein ACFLYA_01985, partial [Candidatus Dependentiae bacterium]
SKLGRTPLDDALIGANVDIAKYLESLGAKVEPNKILACGKTLLQCVSEGGKDFYCKIADSMQYLFEKGANPELKDEEGRTFLGSLLSSTFEYNFVNKNRKYYISKIGKYVKHRKEDVCVKILEDTKDKNFYIEKVKSLLAGKSYTYVVPQYKADLFVFLTEQNAITNEEIINNLSKIPFNRRFLKNKKLVKIAKLHDIKDVNGKTVKDIVNC